MRLFATERSGGVYRQVLMLAGVFRSGGGRALLAGGAVRDSLLGERVKDFDLEVHGLSPERVLELLGGRVEVDTVGMSFGVIKVRHAPIDISLPRRENKIGAGHRGFLVELDPELGVAEAAARRDFTINAMMYDPLTDDLIDPWGGEADLKRGVLRHVSRHFSEDPLRVLRGMQFAARLGFAAAPETLALCAALDQGELPLERIGAEWEKMLLQGRDFAAGFEFLRKSRWIRFYPELEAASATPRFGRLLDLCARCALLRTGERRQDLRLMAAALTAFLAEEAADCAPVAESFCRRLWNSSELISRSALLASAFREFEGLPPEQATGSLCRRLALKLDGVELFLRLLGAAGKEELAGAFMKEANSSGVLTSSPRPLLTGRHGIAAGIPPGPELGSVLNRCFEAQLDGVFADTESGMDYLRRLIAEDAEKILKKNGRSG